MVGSAAVACRCPASTSVAVTARVLIWRAGRVESWTSKAGVDEAASRWTPRASIRLEQHLPKQFLTPEAVEVTSSARRFLAVDIGMWLGAHG